jgi:transposase
MEIHILGIDLAKQVFQLHGADRRGPAVHRPKVSRGSLFEAVRALGPGLGESGEFAPCDEPGCELFAIK